MEGELPETDESDYKLHLCEKAVLNLAGAMTRIQVAGGLFAHWKI